jgi:hypothetical protein
MCRASPASGAPAMDLLVYDHNLGEHAWLGGIFWAAQAAFVLVAILPPNLPRET